MRKPDTIIIPRELGETLLALTEAAIAEWYPEAIKRNRNSYQSLLDDRDALKAALNQGGSPQ